MKKQKIKLIALIFITIIIMFLLITNKSQATMDVTEDIEFWKPNDIETSEEFNQKLGDILGVVSTLGVITSVGTLSIIGIKFLLGSVEEKAQYKQALIPWLIGASLVFSITTVPNIIYNAMEGANKISTGIQISIDKSQVALKIGENEEIKLNATVISEERRVVTWMTSDSRVATVDSMGKVKARKEGTAVITAAVGQARVTCTVMVEAAKKPITPEEPVTPDEPITPEEPVTPDEPVTPEEPSKVKTIDIELSRTSLTFNAPIEKIHQLQATVSPAESKEPVVWSSSNSNVATVVNGKVKAVGVGSATITAKSGTKTATCTIQVNSSRVYKTQYYNESGNIVSATKTSNADIGFWIYIPEISQVSNMDKLPLIIYLHGSNKRRK